MQDCHHSRVSTTRSFEGIEEGVCMECGLDMARCRVGEDKRPLWERRLQLSPDLSTEEEATWGPPGDDGWSNWVPG